MNSNKLKGKILENGRSYEECARHIGISTTSFSKKVNNQADFKLTEAEALGNFLGLTNKEKLEIFLN